METLSGERLRLFRIFLSWLKGKRVTQKDMAEMLDISEVYLRKAEAGKRSISTKQLKRVLEVVQGGEPIQMPSKNPHKSSTSRGQPIQKITTLRPIKIGGIEATPLPIESGSTWCRDCDASGVCPEQKEIVKRQGELPRGYAYFVTFCPYYRKRERHYIKHSTIINYLDYLLSHNPNEGALRLLRSLKGKREHFDMLRDAEERLRCL